MNVSLVYVLRGFDSKANFLFLAAIFDTLRTANNSVAKISIVISLGYSQLGCISTIIAT